MTILSSNVLPIMRAGIVSDIHLGHPRNRTSHIIANLNRFLVTDEFMASIDVLFIAGDLYDSLLSTYSDDYALIGTWCARLLRHAHRHKVAIRLLEGTRSHDRGQGIQLVTLNNAYAKLGKSVDLKYFNDITIDHMDKWGLNVLYIPDDLPSPQDTLDRVKALMHSRGLTTVDIAIMHGNFQHQLPSGLSHIPMHDNAEYSKLVRSAIFIGHHHVSSVDGKIHAQGSFDRLSHNEEESKGFFRAVFEPERFTVKFIENTGAAIYKTLSCDQDSVAENLIKIDEIVKLLPDGSNLRIEANVGNPIFDNLNVVKERWPLHNWTNVVRGKEKKKAGPLLDHKLVYVPVTLDRQTLHPTLMTRLMQKNYSPEQLTRCETILTQFTKERNGI